MDEIRMGSLPPKLSFGKGTAGAAALIPKRARFFPAGRHRRPFGLGVERRSGHHFLGGRKDDRRAGLAILRRIAGRSEEHTSELQSLMRISYAVFCLKKKKLTNN